MRERHLRLTIGRAPNRQAAPRPRGAPNAEADSASATRYPIAISLGLNRRGTGSGKEGWWRPTIP